MRLRRLSLFSIAFCLLCLPALSAATKAPERLRLLNDGWLFAQGDSDFTQAVRVDLPHDWSILQPFDPEAPAGNDGAYLPTGRGWYRKTLRLGREYEGRRVALHFEGIYMNSAVYVNGHRAGGWPYGYTSFTVEATPYLNTGGENEIVVSVDNSQQKNCRWYTGSGIYRNVWLVTTAPLHIAPWGVGVRTQPADGAAEGRWSVDVEVKIVQGTDIASAGRRTVRNVVTDLGGRTVASAEAPAGDSVVCTRIEVEAPALWSPDAPALYRLTTELTEDGRTVDATETEFGFRTVAWSAERGFELNGRTLKMNGACLHHDNGILGAAAYDRAEWRKAELMKAAGFNAVRTAHNPPSPAFLTACDHVGLLVIDEAFDGWRDAKNEHDYHELIDEWWQRDLDALVLRDRNHPSVVCWSIGNEVIERKHIGVVKTARQMASRCRELDPTRPVTSALAAWDADWDIYDPLAAEHDIVGYNYMIHKAEEDHRRVPGRVMVQTESFPRDVWQNWHAAATHPYIVGDFVWTGLDYLGESGIGRWWYDGDPEGEHWVRPLYPWHAAYCGDVDLTGWRKPISHRRAMLWQAEGAGALYLAVREPDGYFGGIHPGMWAVWPTWESWTWPGWEGKPVEVEVYARGCDSVRLVLDDAPVAVRPVERGMATFTLPYRAGTLRAEAVGGDAVPAMLRTAGAPVALRLTPDRTRLAPGGQDLSFVTVEVVDAEGNLCPLDSTLLTFEVRGAASLLAAGNADIRETDPYYDARHPAWRGRALAVLRAGRAAGSATLTVRAPGLKAASVAIKVKP